MGPLHCARAPSAARSFVSIAIRKSASTPSVAQKSSTPLEFLVPRCASSFHSTVTPRSSPAVRPSFSQSAAFLRYDGRRAFSASAVRKGTVCVRNPVQDEDGKDMVLEITARAAKRLSQIMNKDANPDLALRIQVESGGCHGFQYLMSLVTIPSGELEGESSIVGEDDIIFQFVSDEASPAPPSDAARIILDEPSLELLKGSKVDFTQELIGSQFQIVDNPYASTSCGCGTSFDIKM